MKLPHFKKEKVVVIALIFIILLGTGMRVKGFFTNKNANTLLLSHVITNEAWTIAKYSKYFSLTNEFANEIYERSKTDPLYLYSLSSITPPSNPTFTPQLLDEHGAGIVLGLIWKITGDANVNWMIWLQILLDITSIYLIFLAGKNFFTPTVGLIGALGLARFPAQINAITDIHTYHWTTIFSTIILFLCSLIYIKKKEKFAKALPYLILTGLIIGFSVWLRSSSQTLLISTLLLLFFITKNLKRFLAQSTIIVLTTIITLSPLIAFNYSATGDFAISRGIKWHTFLAGFGAIQNPYGLETSDGNIVEKIHERNPEITGYMGNYETRLKPYEKEAQKFYFEILKENPFLVLKSFLYRFFKIRQFENHSFGGIIQFTFIFYCFIYAFFWGLVFTKKRINILSGLLVYTLSYYTALSIIYYPDIVYVFPAYPAWYLIAGHSVYTFIKFIKKQYPKLNAKKA